MSIDRLHPETVRVMERNAMLHRHLNHQRFTLAAIDDIISRGRRQDWAELREALLQNSRLLDAVEKVCRPYASDPYAQRYQFWIHYVEEKRFGSATA